MFIKTKLIILIQMFCQFLLISKVIFKIVIDPDDYFRKDILDNTFHSKAYFWKIHQGEMFIKTKLIILIKMFCRFLLDSKVIFKSAIDPDDYFMKVS